MLESTRLGKAVTFTHRMHPAIPANAMIPALLLQPALENALWHGFDDSVHAPRVHLEATPMREKERWLVLTLLDNGVGLGQGTESGASEGLQLVREKVLTMAKNANVVVKEVASPWSTMARVTLPLALPESGGAASEATALHPSHLEAHP